MTQFYEVVCLNCGEIYEWCKCDPPLEKCDFCGCRLSDGERWSEDARVFGEWPSGLYTLEAAKMARMWFFSNRPRGYRFRLPNGVWCTVKLNDYPEFWFHFTVCGERISLLIRGLNLADKVELLKKTGTVPMDDVCMVVYKKQTYSPLYPAGLAIIKAIEVNEKPELVAVACL